MFHYLCICSSLYELHFGVCRFNRVCERVCMCEMLFAMSKVKSITENDDDSDDDVSQTGRLRIAWREIAKSQSQSLVTTADPHIIMHCDCVHDEIHRSCDSSIPCNV